MTEIRLLGKGEHTLIGDIIGDSFSDDPINQWIFGGGKLMAAGLQRADAEHMPVYLESSKESNVPFYRRFGFELIEKVTPAKGCPSMWPMWREPV
jgi:hypothetical protein